MRVNLADPNAPPWTRTDEVRQRIKNVVSMLRLTWFAMRYPAHLFALVLLNLARSEGDALIVEAKNRKQS